MPRLTTAVDDRLRLLVFFAVAVVAVACHSGSGEGIDVGTLPANVREDYRVFAQRCSKCHALARPLESGITNDAYWAEYVERMRRQPGSGISPADVTPILRFLHYYSSDERRRRSSGSVPDAAK